MDKSFAQLIEEFEAFLTRRDQVDEAEILENAGMLLADIRESGRSAFVPEERAILSAVGRDLGDIIFATSGQYPSVRLLEPSGVSVEQYDSLPGPEPGAGRRIPLVEHERRAEHFTGRGDELAALLEDLQPGRTVTLWGPGGVGKSALAAEALWTLAPGQEAPQRFPDGIVLHDFYRQPQASAALEAIARAYGEEPQPTAVAAARRVLAVRSALIVLDGAENADDLDAVLSVSGSCGVLITTRRREDIRGTAHEIEPLENPEAVDLLQALCANMSDTTLLGNLG